jgi:hypothetical protein
MSPPKILIIINYHIFSLSTMFTANYTSYGITSCDTVVLFDNFFFPSMSLRQFDTNIIFKNGHEKMHDRIIVTTKDWLNRNYTAHKIYFDNLVMTPTRSIVPELL